MPSDASVRKERTTQKLKPVLGLVQLAFYGIGVIVGTASTRSSAAQREWHSRTCD